MLMCVLCIIHSVVILTKNKRFNLHKSEWWFKMINWKILTFKLYISRFVLSDHNCGRFNIIFISWISQHSKYRMWIVSNLSLFLFICVIASNSLYYFAKVDGYCRNSIFFCTISNRFKFRNFSFSTRFHWRLSRSSCDCVCVL